MSVCMPWYTRESWRRLEEVTEAPLCESYDAYVRIVEQMIAEFAERGIVVVKTLVDIDDMVTWCHGNGHRVDSRGRAAYGAMVAAWRGSGGHTTSGRA